MLTIIVRRLIIMVPVIFLVSLMVFSLLLLVPGDPAVTLAGENASPEQIAATRERLGLDDPIVVQYARWASGLVQGDFGTSLFSSQEVIDSITQRLPATLSLTIGALTVALVVGVPAGIIAATRRGRWPDRVLTLFAAAGLALPNYFLGMILILFFALWNPLLPATGYVPFSEDAVEWFRRILLPSITLGIVSAAVITRQLRSSLIGVTQQDYIRTARAKGLRSRVVILKHGLKNAAIPVVTVLGSQVAFLLGGSAVVERVFAVPGIGSLAIDAVLKRDLPVIQGVVVMATVVVLVMNLLVDISYGWLNPKVRVQ